ncbi:MAG: hypothetical protein JO307_23845 [Bryobacterales bacterium]|nr:hypothetical protein [Bryobacterales bacterium]
MKYPTLYRTTKIDGISVFYRESGQKDAPTLLPSGTFLIVALEFMAEAVRDGKLVIPIRETLPLSEAADA